MPISFPRWLYQGVGFRHKQHGQILVCREPFLAAVREVGCWGQRLVWGDAGSDGERCGGGDRWGHPRWAQWPELRLITRLERRCCWTFMTLHVWLFSTGREVNSPTLCTVVVSHNSVRTLTTCNWCQNSQVKGSVPQDCSHFGCQSSLTRKMDVSTIHPSPFTSYMLLK